MRYVQNFLLNLIIPLLVPAWLSAGPMLVCDPYPVTELQPTSFVVVLDGTTHDVVPERYPDGSSRLNHDLGKIGDGAHTAKVKAVNSAVNPQTPLESAWVTISFMKAGSQIARTKDESEKLQPTRTFKGYLRDEH